MNEKIQDPKYTKRRNSDFTYDILKDGHTMFSDDIIQELKRKAFLEKELSKEHVENKDGEMLDHMFEITCLTINRVYDPEACRTLLLKEMESDGDVLNGLRENLQNKDSLEGDLIKCPCCDFVMEVKGKTYKSKAYRDSE